MTHTSVLRTSLHSSPNRYSTAADRPARFDLPHRVYTAIVYPVEAQHGSPIIIYGHQRGLTFLWRRGRTQPRKRGEVGRDGRPRTEHTTSTSANDYADKHEADVNDEGDEPQETQGSFPYEPITSSLDADLITPVLQISACPLPRHPHQNNRDTIPRLLSSRILIAVNCGDGSTRIISAPVKPPRSLRIDLEDYESRDCLQQLILSKPYDIRHCQPRALAVSYSGSLSVKDDMHDHDADAMELDSVKVQNTGREAHTEKGWALKIVSHMPEPSPRLHIWHVRFENGNEKHLSAATQQPTLETIQTPSICSSISFNPSHFPSKRHAQLLLVDLTGNIRICEILDSGLPPKWLISFVPPFQNGVSAVSSSTHRLGRIIDARWALAGKVVVALLRDGRWGIWDIEGVRPVLHGAKSLASSPNPGIRGGGITPFSLHGYVGDAQSSQSRQGSDSTRSTKSKASSILAPMTPNTRKLKQENLFASPSTPSNVKKSSFISGAISLTAVSHSSGTAMDDSLILYYHSTFHRISSLMDYWKSAIRIDERHGGSSSGSTTPGPRIKQALQIDIGGELVTNLSQFPEPSDASNGREQPHSPPSVLISAEHRLVMLCPLKEAGDGSPSQSLFETSQEHNDVTMADQSLLARGELGLDGVDRLLDGMANSEKRPGLFGQSVAKRRVEFAANH